MFSRNRDDTPRERNSQDGISRPFTASSLCVFLQRNSQRTSTTNDPEDGVSTYLALTFGTLLSSQGTDASFVLTALRAFLRALPFGLAFPTLSDRFPIRFPRCFPGFRFRVSLSGGSDFIRSSESEFPPRSGLAPAHECAGFPFRRRRKRTGAGRPDANRGAPLRVQRRLASRRQTSTTTGRIIGRRR